eukprot:1151676-Pelagomonas_calceolata.AAC.5
MQAPPGGPLPPVRLLLAWQAGGRQQCQAPFRSQTQGPPGAAGPGSCWLSHGGAEHQTLPGNQYQHGHTEDMPG